MKSLEQKVKDRVEKLDRILSEYENLNRENKCKYIERERALERELILLEELLNNVDTSERWLNWLEEDKKDASG